MQISQQQPKGWSDEEVDQLLDSAASLEITTQTILEHQAQQNETHLWFYFFFIMMIGYVVARHFTPTEREITR